MTPWEYILQSGLDFRFWGTVSVASALKWLFTPETHQQTRKQAVAGIVAGAACSFYGADFIMTKFTITNDSRDIVLIGLVFTGEHIVRTLFNLGPMLARKLMGITEAEFNAFKQKDKTDVD